MSGTVLILTALCQLLASATETERVMSEQVPQPSYQSGTLKRILEDQIPKPNINECSSDPCQNGGKCVDDVNGYTCACVDGFTGQDCETDINECSSDPCQNGGTCVDDVNGYTCACVDGFTGQHCGTDTNEGSSDPCQNGGTCLDDVNGYTWTCVDGFTGQPCETEQKSNQNVPSNVIFDRDHCVHKVVVRKHGDCSSETLTGAVVRLGSSPTELHSTPCGSPVTEEVARRSLGFVDFVCNPPMTAKVILLDVPGVRVTAQHLCEVTVEHALPGPCLDEEP